MKHAGPLEIEIKVRIPSVAILQPMLVAAGFALLNPQTRETSVLWDREGELQAQGSVLRLRMYGEAATLTWKGPRLADPRLKIRPEVETALGDPAAMEGILRALGFEPTLHMVKSRSLWGLGDLEACLDEAPFGCFLELEGTREAIEEAMDLLEVRSYPVEPRTYATLFQAWETA